jgi:hypothetical protein
MRQVPGDACRLTLSHGPGSQRARAEQAQNTQPRGDTHQAWGTINKAPLKHRQLAHGASAQAGANAAQETTGPGAGGC